jgi:hypothetical protein
MNNIEKLLRQREEIYIINNGITKPKQIYYELLQKGHGISKRQLRRDLKEIGKTIPDAQRNSNIQKLIRSNEKPIIKINQLLKETESIENIETRIRLQNDLHKTLILANKQQFVVLDRLSIIPSKEEMLEYKKDKDLLNKFKLVEADILNVCIPEMHTNPKFKDVMYTMLNNNKLHRKFGDKDEKGNLRVPSEMETFKHTYDMNKFNFLKERFLEIYNKYKLINELLDWIILSVRLYQIDIVKREMWSKARSTLKRLIEDDYKTVKDELEFSSTISANEREIFAKFILPEESKERIYKIMDMGLIEFLLSTFDSDIAYLETELAKSDKELIEEDKNDQEQYPDDEYEPINIEEYRKSRLEELNSAKQTKEYLEQLRDEEDKEEE